MATSGVRSESPLVVIAGPTASGKTSLAIELAERFGGEIICADSRTVYRGMDIGTAKPTAEERERVPHWGLDLVEPGERFTAAAFKAYTLEKIEEIRSRGKIPFLVGGTGLYIDAVIFDYEFGGEPDPEQRRQLEGMPVEELQKYCVKNNIELPTNRQNKRHLVRAIEQKSINTKRRTEPIPNAVIVGIATDHDILRERIHARTEHMFENYVVEEAILLGKKYGWRSEAMSGNIYPLIHQHTEGVLSLDETKQKFETADWHLVKRQLTWLKRNPHIVWKDREAAEHYIASRLVRE